ncbi:MAG: CBS domain-containing protein [Proteobacteria bacterium]|nr:CBS domain-containing protein [Pseudomonadota bacterium]
MEIITTHINADFDTLASMIAARKLHPNALVTFPAGIEKSVRAFLKNFPIPGFFPVKPKDIDLNRIKKLILVDTRQKNRIGLFAEIIDKPGIDIHIYDHHPESEDQIAASTQVIRPYGSTASLMVEIIREKELSISPEEATAMMMGIYEDTGMLTFTSTTEADYLAAAYLLSSGADLKQVSSILQKDLSAEEISLINDLNNNTHIHIVHGHEIAISTASSDRYIDDAAMLIHKTSITHHCDANFALIRMENKVYLISRSKTERVDAGAVSAALGGGGHHSAGSATIRDLTLTEAESKLFMVLAELVKELKTACDIMSSPVKEISPGKSLEYAKEIMSKLNINVLPVVSRDRLIGLISRQDTGKAIYHGLGDKKIKDFMTSDYSTVEVDSPLLMAQEIIIEENQKFLPVMKHGHMAGCITRTDLLRVLHQDSKKERTSPSSKTHSKNLKGIIKGRLPGWIQNIFLTASAQADEADINLYLVGGFVRDLIINRKNLDIDFVVEGDGITYAEGLAKRLQGRIKSHKKFGTAVIILPDGFKIDVASARMEFYQTAAELPTVEAGPIKMDLYRRDFTINSMAIKLNKKGFGELLDYFGGVKDIKEKKIRVLHSLSFIEDPTRAFRAVRFEDRFNFNIGKQSLSLIKNAARLNFFDKVSQARAFSELKIILQEEKPLPVLKRMENLGILHYMHPKFEITKETEYLFAETVKVFDWYKLLFKEDSFEKWLIFMAILQESFTLEETKNMIANIGLSTKFGDRLKEIKSCNDIIIDSLGAEDKDIISIYKLLYQLKTETLLFTMSKAKNKLIKEKISLFIRELKDIKVEAGGKEFERLGIKPGPIYKEIKESIIAERLKGNINRKEEEIDYIRKNWIKSK